MGTNNAINITSQGTVYYNGTGTFSGVDGSTAGKVLTSNGTGAAPSFKAASASGAVTTIDGDTGAATPTAGVITFNANSNAGSSVDFTATGSTVSLKVTDASNNTFIGSGSGSATAGNSCTGVGYQTINSSNGSNYHTAVGFQALKSVTTNNACDAFGALTLTVATGAGNTAFGGGSGLKITTGAQNTIFGNSALSNLLTGSFNLVIGQNSGNGYTGSESSNIIIGNNGTASESNVIRIGTQGSGSQQQNSCFIAGIEGVSVSNKNYVTINTSTGQLGSEASTSLFTVKNQVFTSTGTYTPTSGMVYCSIQCLGGGGAGGGAAATGATTGSAGGGGGAGEYAVGIFSAATIGVSQAVTIGAAGTANSGAAGGTGGTTSVGSLITAIGGTGGNTSSALSIAFAGSGPGGSGGTGGDYRTPGQTGGYAYTNIPTIILLVANGASSQLGAGGATSTGGVNATGAAGTGYGSGGGGGSNYTSQTATSGGAGTKGIVIVTEYIIN